MVKQLSIVSVGAGNVATHIVPALEAAGVGKVRQVFSRTENSAERLAALLENASPVTHPAEIMPDADIYLISLADNAFDAVVRELPRNNALWLHTSGSLPLEALSTLSQRTGVFYPLQTFSRDVPVDLREVPLFIEGSDPKTESEIAGIGDRIFRTIHHADSDLRRRMHVAAVFACNFTNHLWTLADDLLRRDDLSLEVLHPLLKETLRKALTTAGSPSAHQTGPAVREDYDVMNAHADSLPSELAAIYRSLSQSIISRKNSAR